MNAEKQANALAVNRSKQLLQATLIRYSQPVRTNFLPSLLKFKNKNGAQRESKPCQYTYCLLLTTHALSIRFNFRCPALEDSSSLY